MSHEQPSQSRAESKEGHKRITSMAKCPTLLILVILCELLTRQRIQASGIFEFELIDLQRLDKLPVGAMPTLRNQQQPSYESHVRLVLCLKEAFASQLDGPCVFGNASLTLNQQRPAIVVASGGGNTTRSHQQQQTTTTRAATSSQVAASEQQLQDQNQTQTQNQYQTSEWNKDGSQQQQNSTTQASAGELEQQQGSHMTNVVRIPFTFRWTKSFTIIITAEEINNAETHKPADLTADEPAASNQTRNQSQSKSAQAQVALSVAGSQITATTTTTTAIDRHVLTENEVLPYLETNLQRRQTWAGRASRTDKTLIVYRFRVYCAPNHYGDGCATFCRPRDDQFGHYKCAPTGQKICLEGWTGQDCQQARCKEACNQQHGFCSTPGECTCRQGWTGARCDECLTYPGCQQGYCLGPWQCHCHKNWGGVLCDQNLNYCGTNEPCLNNATCQNVAPNRYKCNCSPGHTGVNCEHKLDELRLADSLLANAMTRLSAGCALNPCLNGGTCFGFEPQVVMGAAAAAPHNRAGPTPVHLAYNSSDSSPLDEIGVLEQEQRQEAGAAATTTTTTTSPQQIYRCQCPPGWTGDYCQWADALAPTITPETMANESSVVDVTPLPLAPSPAPVNTTVAPSVSRTFSTELAAGYEDQTMNDLAAIGATELEGIHLAQTASSPPAHHLEMRHLISGVVVASAVGVFVAALLLAWCCLLAVEKGHFHFIQMNVIRQSDSCSAASDDASSTGETTRGGGRVSSRLRRVHEKIRDSLRRGSRSRSACIKPETKLSLENVLAGAPKWPPPSYEESNYSRKQANQIETVAASQLLDQAVVADYRDAVMTSTMEFNSNHRLAGGSESYYVKQQAKIATQEPVERPTGSLVKKGALEQEMALKKASAVATATLGRPNTRTYDHPLPPVTTAQINCPRHGHLYRSQQVSKDTSQTATTIAIEYRSGEASNQHQNIHPNHHYHYHHHLNQYHNHHHQQQQQQNQNNISQSATR